MKANSTQLLSIVKWMLPGFLVMLLWQPATTVEAHPADMYVPSQSIHLDGHGAHLDWRILPVPFLADGAWAAANQDHNGTISPDEARGWDQLFMQPVSGGSAVQYMQESAGITGYSMSPNEKTILYTVFKADGGSSI